MFASSNFVSSTNRLQRRIRRALLEAADGNGPRVEDALEHSLHCIESLRQDALCNADDTPRFSGHSKKKVLGKSDVVFTILHQVITV